MQVSDDPKAPASNVKPSLTRPQYYATAAFLGFVLLAWLATDTKSPDASWNLNGLEYDQLRTLTLV